MNENYQNCTDGSCLEDENDRDGIEGVKSEISLLTRVDVRAHVVQIISDIDNLLSAFAALPNPEPADTENSRAATAKSKPTPLIIDINPLSAHRNSPAVMLGACIDDLLCDLSNDTLLVEFVGR